MPPSSGMGFVPGIYLIDLKTGKELFVSRYPASPAFFGLGNRRFWIKADIDVGIEEAYFVNSDGTLTPADPTINYASVAPDKQHWVAIGKTLKVFNADDSLAFDIPLPFDAPESPTVLLAQNGAPQILWRSDSSGLFVVVGTKIYNLDIQNKEIHLVEGNLLPFQHLNFIAIPAK